MTTPEYSQPDYEPVIGFDGKVYTADEVRLVEAEFAVESAVASERLFSDGFGEIQIAELSIEAVRLRARQSGGVI